MRITPQVLVNTLLQNVDNAQSRLNQLQEEASTGQAYQLPEDNPEAVTTTMQLNQSLANIQDYQSTISGAQNYLNTAGGALNDMTTVLNTAQSLAVQASNGTMSQVDRNAIQAQVGALQQQLSNVLNTQYQGTYIFAASNPASSVATLTSIVNYPALTTTAIQSTVEIGQNDSVVQNLTGFEFGATTVATSVFQTALTALNDLYNSLATVSTASASVSPLTEIQSALQGITGEQAIAGARLERLNAQQQRLGTLSTDLSQAVAQTSGANMAQVTTQLAEEEQAYQVALQSGAQVLPLSLLNYIHP